MIRRTVTLTSIILLSAALGCTSPEEPASGGMAADGSYTPIQESLSGPARPGLLLTQAWFMTLPDGTPKPGPARLDIWREGSSGWERTRLEDPDSNVFHKAMPYDGGILTIGAEKAMLKKWTHAGGKWTSETIWQQSWGGQFDRLRDVEIGDVDHDGRDEIVIATHDAGVVAVIDPAEAGEPMNIREMDQKADTFVHEIEIGDIDGDGKLEFFATPSDRNKVGHSQAGGVVMYRWKNDRYVRSWVDQQEGTHAKEILTADIDGDGTHELFSVLEAELDPNDKSKIVKPVEIRQYTLSENGNFSHHTVATIDDRQTRFLLAGDFDADGRMDLVAAAFKTGLYHITQPSADGPKSADGRALWKSRRIDGNSSGFEHAAFGADMDGDGGLELYVAADDQRQIKRYTHQGAGKFKREIIGALDDSTITWNITTGTF